VVGIIGVVIGVWLLANPLAGAVSLTMAVAVLMLGLGIAKIWACLPLKGTGYFWPIDLSGAISIVLGLMILVNFPYSAVMVLGTFLAAELVLSGISAISLGWATKTSKAD
jgi:uncharacterized membrane protein HdeD (DUF308 family)